MTSILRSFEKKHLTDKNKEQFFKIEPLQLLRKLDKMSRVKPSINFYSHKSRALQYAESILETDAYLRLEFDPKIKRYLTQPCSFKLKINNRTTRYTPDVLVESTQGLYSFLEVKPMRKYQEGANQEKFSQIKAYFENELNVPFIVLTEEDIREDKLIPSLQQLYRFLDIPLDNKTTKKILAHSTEGLTVNALEKICCKHAREAHYAWALLAQGYFNFHYENMLTKSTLISINYSRLGA